MLKPESVRCDNCTFYVAGHCKRYPPQFVNRSSSLYTTNYGGNSQTSETHSPSTEFPTMGSYDFCGEFLPTDNLTAVEWVAWKKGLIEDGQMQK